MTTRTISRAIALCALAAYTTTALADDGRLYGADAPFTVEQLPQGPLRATLDALSPEARARAMAWLHSFTFPEADLERLAIDPDGGVFYIDPGRAESGEPQAAPAQSQTIGAEDVFRLHSKPGASKIIYIDVDGEVISGTAWNGSYDPLYAKPFDTDGNPTSFSAAERAAIAEMWHRVAEDYAPFDVDVTTEAPASYGRHTGHLLITDDRDELGRPMPAQGAGGVAYVNVYGSANYPYYSPAFVYANRLGPDFPPFITEAGSHEMGHNLGLSHDGTSTSGYYGGHGSGWVSWGPIMGTGFNRNVSQWSRGEYAGANNTQDDIAIIAGKVAMRGDDHGDTFASASLLAVNGDGSVSATNPETDPFNTSPANKGIVGTRSDADLFAFSAGSGNVALTVTPAWAAYTRNSYGRGANLDIEVTLYDANGIIVSRADPLDNTNATISANVAAGDYYLAVTGVGNAQSPYSDYGSEGQYFIAGSVPPPAPDTTAPSPNPMTWALPPAAEDHQRIAMTATTATDNARGELQYYFACISGGAGCADSGWQSDSHYSADGLAAQTEYRWQVKARDLSGNETAYSEVASATTGAPPAPPAAPDATTASDNRDGSATIGWRDNSGNETGFEVERESWNGNAWQFTTVIASTGANASSTTDASGEGRFRYRVRAFNDSGASAYSPWAEVEVTRSCSGLVGCTLEPVLGGLGL